MAHGSALTEPRSQRGVGNWQVVLAVVALTTLGITQPLLDLLGRNAAFLVAHNMGRFDVLAFAVIVVLVLPMAVGAVLLLWRRLHRTSGELVISIVVAVLIAAVVLVALRLTGASEQIPAWTALALAGVVGLAGAVLWRRFAGLRRGMTIAAVAAPLALVGFLLLSPAKGLAFPSSQGAGAAGIPADAPSVVLVIFDELPTVSLMDEQREIDDDYPGFRRLARDSTWYRNATSPHDATSDAVPAILTGQYNEPGSLPVASEHPQNLFSLLRPTHRRHVEEVLTDLCTGPGCAAEEETGPSLVELLNDLAVVEGHLLLPPDMASGLPTLDEGFRNFGGATDAAADAEAHGHASDEITDKKNRQAFIERFNRRKDAHLPAQFRAWTEKITKTKRPGLHVIHVLLPHKPWRYLRNGQVYAGIGALPGTEDFRWNSPWFSVQGYQRHLLQMQVVDRLVNGIITQLKAEGMYDDTVIAVTADHGVSFVPDGWVRRVTKSNVGDIMAVPMFIKAPGQRQPEISDRPVENIDIAPTVIDLLGGTPLPAMDGRSLVDPATDVLTEKRTRAPHIQFTYPADGAEKWPRLAYKFDVFDTVGGRLDLFSIAPPGTKQALRAPVPTGSPVERLRAVLDYPGAYRDVDLAAPTIPVLVTGTLHGVPRDEPAPAVAIGVNGRIEAITEPDPGDSAKRKFRAMVPPESLRDGRNTITISVIDGAGQPQPVRLTQT